jgi:tRNA-2-methylthio-N6-dimethylallyladenosine synthase
LEDAISDEEKARRLAVLNEKQRVIQKQCNERYLGTTLEVMVEGKNEARRQWIGRTSQNKVFNFTAPDTAKPNIGGYVTVVTTGSFPNSLLGEIVV